MAPRNWTTDKITTGVSAVSKMQLMPHRRGQQHVKSASWLRVTASCWCLAGTRVSVLSVCVCIFDVYPANYRKTLIELD